MFCPQCKMEYLPGVMKCSDCDAELVASLPEPAPKSADLAATGEDEVDFDDLVSVYETTVYSNLLIATSMLESAGVEFWTKGDSLRSMFFSGELLVKPDDETEATEILAELESMEETGEQPGD